MCVAQNLVLSPVISLVGVQRYPDSESLRADPGTGHVGSSRNGFYLEFPERRELILNLNQAFPIPQRRRWRSLRLQAVLTVSIKLWGVGWCSRAERATELYGVHVKRVDPQLHITSHSRSPGQLGTQASPRETDPSPSPTSLPLPGYIMKRKRQ